MDDSLSVLGSVETLKQALQFPGMKFCLKEYFNMYRATWFVWPLALLVLRFD